MRQRPASRTTCRAAGSDPAPARRVVTKMATAVKRREMFIGGEWVQGSGSEGQPIVNPATGETIAEVPKGTEADVDRAVKAARKAYTEWFETTPRERSEMLLKLADAILADAEEMANLESANV